MEDRCVSCGVIIPEGRQVCPSCEKGNRKFTDDEIIKALEWCIQSESCEYCEYREKTNKVDVCTIKQDALALINRQKAEIERLYKEIGRIPKMTVETNVKEMTEGGE